MDYLVTGGAGFIGSNIVRHLVAQGKSVRVLDNLASGRMTNIQDLLGKIHFIEGDIRNPETARTAANGVTNVLHLAAMPSVQRSVQDPVMADQVNIGGTLNMLVAARDAGVRRFVFSSSSSVYGDTPELPKREDMLPMPLSPYAVQKLAGEHYCRIFRGLYGLPAYVLRYFNVFGPRQNPKSQYAAVIPLFIQAIGRNKPPTIHGDGEQTRDFTFVEDVVRANLCCCEAPESAAGDVYNVACGTRISINELAETIARLLKKDIRALHDAAAPGDVRDSQGDSSKARRVLSWNWKVSFEDGLRATIDYFAGQE